MGIEILGIEILCIRLGETEVKPFLKKRRSRIVLSATLWRRLGRRYACGRPISMVILSMVYFPSTVFSFDQS